MITALLITAALAAAAGFFAAVLLTGSGRDDAYRAGRRDAFADRIRWDDHEVERVAAPDSTMDDALHSAFQDYRDEGGKMTDFDAWLSYHINCGKGKT